MDKSTAAFSILEHALPHVAFDGWTMEMLSRAAEEVGYRKGDVVRVFPRGVADALDIFSRWADAQMLAAYRALPAPPEKIRARIAALVRLRLEALAPHREAVRRTLAISALPLYAPQAMRALSRSVDIMWREAGDNSTDFNWYTKRALLAGVYASALLAWLNDDSPGFATTRAFLDRRIEDVMRIQRFKARFSA